MIVVTGATGNVGRPLVAALAAAGEQVTAVSRRPLTHGFPEGVRHVQADLADSESLRPAVEGGDALFILLAGELLNGGESPAALLDVARVGGVRRVVLLSSLITATRPEAASHGRLREFEEAVRESTLDWTILRPGGFASNAFAWAETIRADRTVIAPFGDVALPVVDPADIAEVAAVVLRDEGHAGQTYELTGPAAITPRQQAEAIADVLGEEVRFVEVSREEVRAHMARFMPEAVVDGTLDILGKPLPTEQRVSSDIEKILGRPAGPFVDWVKRNIQSVGDRIRHAPTPGMW